MPAACSLTCFATSVIFTVGVLITFRITLACPLLRETVFTSVREVEIVAMEESGMTFPCLSLIGSSFNSFWPRSQPSIRIGKDDLTLAALPSRAGMSAVIDLLKSSTVNPFLTRSFIRIRTT
ncbi:hypothetical protein D3C81_853860 [compost metagenome]